MKVELEEPAQIEVRAIDVVPDEHAIWCTVGDRTTPFANTIEFRSWSQDGDFIWFLLGTHNTYKAKPEELMRVVVLKQHGERPDPKSAQFDNAKFLESRPRDKPKLDCGCDESKALRAELTRVTRERDYLLTGVSESEARVMRAELAKEKT